jgi:tetratricopeptide (TPR) repeat protein
MVLMMGMNLKKIVLGSLFLMATGGLFGQRNLLKYADIEYDLRRFEHAGAQYAEAYELKQTYYSAKRAAESYSFIKSYQKSFEWWSKAIAFQESDRSDYLKYAQSAIQARMNLTDLGISLEDGEKEKVYGSSAIPSDEGIVFNGVERYNGIGSDYGIREDLLGKVYFVSDRGEIAETLKKGIRFDARKRFLTGGYDEMNNRGFHKIYQSDQNGKINGVGVDLEGVYHISMPFFYKNGNNQEVIFTAVVKDNIGRKVSKHEVFPGLYKALVNLDGSFGQVQALPFNNLSSYGVMHGVIFENKIFFSSNMPGGQGGYDLY